MNLREQVPLAPLTTLGVGGPARYFVEAENESDAREALQFAAARGLPLFVLGGGSNLVVADGGFGGLVLKIALRGVEVLAEGADMLFHVAAGEDWDEFVARAVEDNCAGIECLSGIPGTVGGTPVQNVGAYGQEVAETIREVVALDRQSMEVTTFRNEDCGFGYRSSMFNSADRDRYIILHVSFALRKGGSSDASICGPAENVCRLPDAAFTVAGARCRTRDSPQEVDAAGSRRRRCSQRGIVLQKPCR